VQPHGVLSPAYHLKSQVKFTEDLRLKSTTKAESFLALPLFLWKAVQSFSKGAVSCSTLKNSYASFNEVHCKNLNR
jgi:hypothetical protein